MSTDYQFSYQSNELALWKSRKLALTNFSGSSECSMQRVKEEKRGILKLHKNQISLKSQNEPVTLSSKIIFWFLLTTRNFPCGEVPNLRPVPPSLGKGKEHLQPTHSKIASFAFSSAVATSNTATQQYEQNLTNLSYEFKL